MEQRRRIASPIDWIVAPDWLTVEEACFLSGWDRDTMLHIIDQGGVDLNTENLIEKQSLLEFQECLALVYHWNDATA